MKKITISIALTLCFLLVLSIASYAVDSASNAKILQVNFKLNISGNEYEQAAAGAAPVIANVAGLRWKVWIMNEAEHEAGGIYLFDNQSSLDAFLAGPIVAKVKSNPAYSDISMKQFDVLDKLTQITRGPIDLNQITAVGKTVVASNVKILQVNFKNSTPRNELEQAFAGAAQPIADVPGLRWKVWIMNEAEHEVGGIYLFNDQSSLEAYLAGPIVAGLKSSPANTDISAKQFDVLDKLTQVTRGPIGLKQTISASSLKILQVNFKINISGNEYEQGATGAAPVIANVAGLRWKVWIMNEVQHEAGGIYLFDDQSSLEAFIAGPIVAKVKSNPAYSDISMKQFDVLDKLTQVTRGPIDLNKIPAGGQTLAASNVKILQVNFKNSTPRNELEQAFAGGAPVIADVPGLRWKVWIMNEAEHEVGGIYLFNDQSSLEAYLAGPIIAKAKSNPANSDISMKQFDVLDKLTQVTRGPIGLKQIPAGSEDFSNTFFMSLNAGLNMISLPLKPSKEMTARDLMKETGSTVVIKYDTDTNHFSGFSQTGSGNGFNLEGGKGYIVNVPASKVIPFVGAAWTNQPPLAPPSGLKSSGWAFVVSGNMSDYQTGDYTVIAKNLRTGNISTDSIADGRFNVVFADLNRNSVVEAGDKVEIVVKDSTGNIVAGPTTKQIGTGDIQMAFSDITIKFGYLRPQNSILLQNYPNPFNPETWIPFNLAKEADVNVRIYDTGGKLVRSLSLGRKDPGVYTDKDKAIHWDGKSEFGEVVSSGIYFYTIQAGEFSATRKMIVKK